MDWDYSDRDVTSGNKKIAEAALSYVQTGPRLTGVAGLKGFKGSGLHPMEFREQLKRAFGVLLTRKELGAVVNEMGRSFYRPSTGSAAKNDGS